MTQELIEVSCHSAEVIKVGPPRLLWGHFSHNESKLLVSPLITPIILLHIIPYIILLRSLDYGS